MKAKRFGLISIFLIFCAILVTGGYFGWLVINPVLVEEVKEKVSVDRTGVPLVNQQVRTTMNALVTELDQLRIPATAVQGNVNMEMLGYSGQSIASDQAIANRPDEDLSTHVVSMAYVSGASRYAVIDGEMYQEGDELKGETGAKVRNITTEKVLIAGRSIRQWVRVFNPIKIEKKTEEPKEEVKVVAAEQPKAPAPQTAMGGLGDALQVLKNYSDVMNSLKQ